jgi:hypothetical protein
MFSIYVLLSKVKVALGNKRGELGLGTLISIAVAIIVAAFVMIPGLRSFGASVLSSMTDWWTNTVQNDIFPSS